MVGEVGSLSRPHALTIFFFSVTVCTGADVSESTSLALDSLHERSCTDGRAAAAAGAEEAVPQELPRGASRGHAAGASVSLSLSLSV